LDVIPVLGGYVDLKTRRFITDTDARPEVADAARSTSPGYQKRESEEADGVGRD
jgi:hypothetical protein